MPNIQEVFNMIQEANRERRDIKGQYNDTLANLVEYREVTEEIKRMQFKKKQIETAIQTQLINELKKLEAIESSIKGHSQTLSDLVLAHLVKGESVSIIDDHNTNWEPIFNVKFKKAV